MNRRIVAGLALTALIGLVIATVAFNSSAAPPTPSPHNYIGYVEITGVEGPGHQKIEGAIEIRSFDFAVEHPGGSTGGGGGGTSGKPNFKFMTVVADLDMASPILFRRLVTGQHIPSVTVSLEREQPQPFKTYTLTDVTIESLREYSVGFGTDTPTQEISFKFRKINSAFSGENQEGQPVNTSFCWDLAQAKKC